MATTAPFPNQPEQAMIAKPQGDVHGNALELLLEKGADVNAQGGRYGNALQAASFGGYERIVRLLLEKGAGVNAQGGSYDNELFAALSEGYYDIARLRLENGWGKSPMATCWPNSTLISPTYLGKHDAFIKTTECLNFFRFFLYPANE
ncbi:hypothetical protein N7510_001516 [Penicillium lagena]|uniref:uncharacterized protein n=1 Tax=Penicillium lagena TaxID=94218 RepID=UPI0025424BC2|nr:uncharacterized protein N7510_001516 [Penicillium lagena]KAJ5625207.1 hypothetical protein N7510_001516 [Penicillium lagena]